MKRYTLVIIVIALLAWWAQPAHAQDDLDVIAAQAEQAYQAQDYALAVSRYEQIVAAGVTDTAVYFNLASAYYQAGQIGWALLTYLRAAQLAPRDDRIQTQIALLRSERVTTIRSSAPPPLVRLAESTNDFTQAEFRRVAWTLWLSACILTVVYWFRPEIRSWLRYVLALLGMMALIANGLLIARISVEETMPVAVTVVTSAEVYSGPGEDYLPLYALYEGAEVRILDVREGWVRFVLPDGRYGWLDGGAIRRVTP